MEIQIFREDARISRIFAGSIKNISDGYQSEAKKRDFERTERKFSYEVKAPRDFAEAKYGERNGSKSQGGRN